MSGVNVALLSKSMPSTKNLTPVDSPIKLQGVLGLGCLIDGSIASIIDPVNLIGSKIQFTEQGYRTNIIPKFKINKQKLLIVDDSAVARSKLAKLYSKYGFDIDFAENGLDALKKVESENYTLISTDAEMPFATGFDFVKSMSGSNLEFIPPVIMVTSRNSDRHRALAEKIGVDVFVSKSEAAKGIDLAIAALTKGERLEIS